MSNPMTLYYFILQPLTTENTYHQQLSSDLLCIFSPIHKYFSGLYSYHHTELSFFHICHQFSHPLTTKIRMTKKN